MIVHATTRKLRRQTGLTMVEILVATTLLMFIALGLTMMFNQTQRAFRGGVRQVDVLEGGRTALEMIARDIAQAAASGSIAVTNFYAGLQDTDVPTFNDPPGGGTPALRTNFLYDLFCLQHDTNWIGVGFVVLHPVDPALPNNLGVGSLYRFSSNRYELPEGVEQFYASFFDPPASLIAQGRLNRIMDGIVHFRVTLYDNNGFELTNDVPIMSETNHVRVIYSGIANAKSEKQTWFRSNALPALVDIELGVLEPHTYEQMKPMLVNPTAAHAFLARKGGQVHMFRQQIRILPARP